MSHGTVTGRCAQYSGSKRKVNDGDGGEIKADDDYEQPKEL
jgi:hypothetical protein